MWGGGREERSTSLHRGCWRSCPFLHPCLLSWARSPRGLFVSAAPDRSFPHAAGPPEEGALPGGRNQQCGPLRARGPGQKGHLGGSSWYFVPFADCEHLTGMKESVSLRAHVTSPFTGRLQEDRPSQAAEIRVGALRALRVLHRPADRRGCVSGQGSEHRAGCESLSWPGRAALKDKLAGLGQAAQKEG